MEVLQKRLNRIWGIWLAGVIFGVVGLKPNSINAAGLSFSIDRPEAIQGVLYLACILYTIHTIIPPGSVAHNPFRQDDFLRNIIYANLGKTKTFVKTHPSKMRERREYGRFIIGFMSWFFFALQVIPAVTILTLNGKLVWNAVKLVFSAI